MALRLVQLSGPHGKRVAVVEEPSLRLLSHARTIYGLVDSCLSNKVGLQAAIEHDLSPERLDYDAVYNGQTAWRILLPVLHPDDPARCHVSGTGLTHKASAKNRDAMHAAAQAVTDSTRMYQAGVEGGRPAEGEVGVSPEWFYKGPGTILRAHGEALTVPDFAEDGGEEPEIAGVYIIDHAGHPRRIGMCVGNEFSDHLFERRNYLYLASSKLRQCSIGPELVIGHDFQHVPGEVSIERQGQPLWTKAIQSGGEVMCHSLANMEHHHFKFDAHRRPGDLHIHFYGADAFSFGEGILLEDGDVMQVRFDGFGRALRNPLRRVPVSTTPIVVQGLD